MGRDIQKAVEDYRKTFYGKENGEGAFYASDIYCIKDMCGVGLDPNTIYKAIMYALEAGFMIGYRAAQRDYRRKKKAAQTL